MSCWPQGMLANLKQKIVVYLRVNKDVRTITRNSFQYWKTLAQLLIFWFQPFFHIWPYENNHLKCRDTNLDVFNYDCECRSSIMMSHMGNKASHNIQLSHLPEWHFSMYFLLFCIFVPLKNNRKIPLRSILAFKSVPTIYTLKYATTKQDVCKDYLKHIPSQTLPDEQNTT